MKFLCIVSLVFIFYSCSNTSNPSNNNSTNLTDSMFIYFDSVSYRGGPPGSNFVMSTNNDTLIKNVRISFLGETDYDSTTVEVLVQNSSGTMYDYIKQGKSAINTDHTFSVDVSTHSTYFYAFKVTMFYPGIFHYVRMKYMRVSMIRS